MIKINLGDSCFVKRKYWEICFTYYHDCCTILSQTVLANCELFYSESKKLFVILAKLNVEKEYFNHAIRSLRTRYDYESREIMNDHVHKDKTLNTINGLKTNLIFIVNKQPVLVKRRNHE